MPTVDPKFANAGKTTGLEIWRVKKFDLETVPKEQFGNFYSGDSYIVLNTKSNDNWDVHFWLGKDTTQDEWGTAAIKTVELDDSLGGIPVQHREVQNFESPQFLSYFRGGIRYLQGGHSTGFNHVVDSFEDWKPRLFHCKGKKNVRCTQVDNKKESLNLGDVFILDKGLNLYVWMPPESGRLERVKGVEAAKSIRDQERAGRPKIVVLDEDWNTSNAFWSEFGGVESVAWIKSPYAGGQDTGFWREKSDDVSLWKVSDASGKMELTNIRKGQLQTSDLQTNDAFILDSGSEIFVWIGKGCNIAERQKAQAYGQEFISKQMRPKWTQITKVLEGSEPQAFAQWFENFQTGGRADIFKPRLYHVSNETGNMTVEEIPDFYQQDLDTDDVMILDALNVVYIWIGDGANRNEKNEGEQTAKKYLATNSIPRHKTANIDVLHQGKESPGFKKLFPEWDDKLLANREKDYKNLRELLF